MTPPWSTAITRRRYGSPAGYDLATGKRAPRTITDTPIRGTVQPTPGATTVLLETGKRAPDTVTAFVPLDTLREANQLASVEADRIYVATYASWYEVQQVAGHYADGFGTRHEAAVCRRIDESTAALDPGAPVEDP